MEFDEFGRELPDPNPIAKPVRFNRPGSTLDEIKRNLGLASRLAEQEGMETFDEADDFQVGDDFDGDHPFAERVDNMNQMYESLRDEIRAARQRGEVLIDQATGTWSRNPDYKPPEGGMGAVRPHGDGDVESSPVPPAPPKAKKAPASSRPDKPLPGGGNDGDD